MNDIDKKLKNCAKLCYDPNNAMKIPHHKLKKTDVVDFFSLQTKLQDESTEQKVNNTNNSTPFDKNINIKGYKILSKIGQGGMGIVYKALQLSMQRIVAIKVLPISALQKKEKVQRFLRESKSVARLNHKNIVSGIDAGTTDKFYYFIMEYVEGRDLGEVLENGPLSAKRAIQITVAVAKALAYANNTHGIIHRDIKPDNILIDNDGNIKLCDLGLARTTSDIITADGIIIGTPHYMSPEQCRGESNLSKSTDMYSLGITLFQMLTTKVPFNAAHPAAICLKHTRDPLPNPKKYIKELPDHLCSVLKKMTQKKPQNRYSSYEELITAISADSIKNIHKLPRSSISSRTARTKFKHKSKMKYKYLSIIGAFSFCFIAFILSADKYDNIRKDIASDITFQNYGDAFHTASMYKDEDKKIARDFFYLNDYLQMKNRLEKTKDKSILFTVRKKSNKGPRWYKKVLKKLMDENKVHYNIVFNKKNKDAIQSKNKTGKKITEIAKIKIPSIKKAKKISTKKIKKNINIYDEKMKDAINKLNKDMNHKNLHDLHNLYVQNKLFLSSQVDKKVQFIFKHKMKRITDQLVPRKINITNFENVIQTYVTFINLYTSSATIFKNHSTQEQLAKQFCKILKKIRCNITANVKKNILNRIIKNIIFLNKNTAEVLFEKSSIFNSFQNWKSFDHGAKDLVFWNNEYKKAFSKNYIYKDSIENMLKSTEKFLNKNILEKIKNLTEKSPN